MKNLRTVCLKLSVYLNEQKAVTLEQAAILADEFVLTHKVNFGDKQAESQSKGQNNRFRYGKFPVSSPAKKLVSDSSTSERVCFYCKKPGHLIRDCPVLSKKQKSTKTVAFVSSPVLSLPSSSSLANVPSEKLECKNGELAGSSSFLKCVKCFCPGDQVLVLFTCIWFCYRLNIVSHASLTRGPFQ